MQPKNSETRCPPIPTVAEGVERPLWSVMIPTYNPNPDYLQQALAGILEQDPGAGDMQIELVDDGSAIFDPAEFLSQKNISRVSFHRQKSHLGIGGNWNRCLELARGRWVHILHQDDLILPGFYERLRYAFETKPEIGAAFCQQFLIDANGNRKQLLSRVSRNAPGILTDWIEHVFVKLSVQTPSIVVRRSVYEQLGGFDLSFDYALDWDMWKRIAARYPLWYEPEPLACYRRHGRAATSVLMRSGKNMAEIGRSIEISKSYLPAALADRMSRQAREYYTWHAVHNAGQLLFFERDLLSTLAQLREGRKITSSAMVVKKIVELALETWRNGVSTPSRHRLRHD